MFAKTTDMLDDLESMVDKHGMINIMLGLVHICDEKSEHVRCNWQDLVLSDAWRGISNNLISKRLSQALNRLPDTRYNGFGTKTRLLDDGMVWKSAHHPRWKKL